MGNPLVHEIELYPPERFKTLLDHEVNRSHRYGDSLTLIDLLIETVPGTAEAHQSAEAFAVNVLNLYVRDTDIPCQKGNEFLILMPATSAPGARTVCTRLKNLFDVKHQTYDRVSFRLSVFMGLATLPIDRSLSSEGLMQHASQALQHARANQLPSVIAFSDIEH